MVSTARIDGSLPGTGSSGLFFSRAWAVDYDFAGSPPFRANQPRLLSSLGFPAPYDRDLEGALRGRRGFSQFLYLFKNGRYLRLDAATMVPDGPDTETAAGWGLPAGWDSLDAVVPGRGAKIEFAYFCRGTEYMRFSWVQNAMSPATPQDIAGNWQMNGPFAVNLDGIVAGQDGLGNKMFPFTTLFHTVDANGTLANSGQTFSVGSSGFARYDFTSGGEANPEVDPRQVVTRWGGLLPLLDTGEAIEIALDWCNRALLALNGPVTPILSAAMLHHFMTATPSAQQLQRLKGRMDAVRNRIAALPDNFQWTRGIAAVSRTAPGTLTEIGDDFSNLSGPNGRAAILIHEAVHFSFTPGNLSVDVPEWAGVTVNGVFRNVTLPIPGVTVSGIAYDAMTPDQAIENPSSYAAFAQEISFNGVDTRFGAARPHE